MTNLPRLVRESANSDYWYSEVERVASSLGYRETAVIEEAWQILMESIDSLTMLAFDYRHRSGQFLGVLKQWYIDQKAKWHLINDELRLVAQKEMPSQVVAHAVHSNLLERLQGIYEHHQAEINGAFAFELIQPPSLPANESHHAREIASLLRRSVEKIARVQASIYPQPYEFDIYRTILGAAADHFEEMAERRTCNEEAA